MKVLHNIKGFLPSSMNWIFRLLKNLPDLQIHIQAERYLTTDFYHPDWTYWNFYFRTIDDQKSVIKGWSKFRFIKRFLLKNIFFRFFPRWSQQKYLAYLKAHEIDLVHSHFGPNAIKHHPIVKKANKPHVISFYGFDYERAPYQNPKIIPEYKKLFNEAKAFICEGTHGAKTLEKYGCPPEKIHVIHLGLESSQIKSAPKSKQVNSLRLIQIANFTEKKGHVYTVKAFAMALQKCPNMHLTLVGSLKFKKEHWILDEINNLVEKYNLREHISFVQAIDFSKLYEYLVQFDVFIHPSCYAKNMDCEGGAPVVILDAQAVGLPVISTYHCDIPDEVIHKTTGLLSKEKDDESLAKNITDFYRMSPSDFEVYSSNAINHVRTNYNIEQSAIQLKEIYIQILEQN